MKNVKTFLYIIAGIAFIATGCYLLFHRNTSSLFNWNTDIKEERLGIQVEVNGYDIEKASKELDKELQSLCLDLTQNGKVVDSISFQDLHITTNLTEQISEAKEINDTFWGFDKYVQQVIPIDLTLEADESAISEIIENLNCVTNFTESKDAYLEKVNDEMKVIPEVYGTEIRKEDLQNLILQSIRDKELIINLDESDIYEKPETLQTDKVLNDRMELYNKVVNVKVEYVFGDKIEKISKQQLSEWVSLNEDELLFDEEAMLSYIEDLAHTYNTFGTKRTFRTTNNEIIVVPAGDYGWSISQTKEVARLIEELKEGNDIHREPTWLYQGYGDYINRDGCDIGNTYVEISIPMQTLWLYVDGNLILTSEFVSGTESNGNFTPSGVFGITYKTRNATLRGRGYATPVKYWMPFNGNIGMHDATWRSSFGGNIYKNSGSHGCINLPLENAKIIYEYMDTFFPVIVYRQAELDQAKGERQ